MTNLVGDHRDKYQLPDDLLIQRARAGDSAAFDDLFTRHKDGVYACLWHLLDSDADLVEDAVGTVFLNAFRGLSRFRGGASFFTWIYRIAVNEAHSRRRQKRRWTLFGGISLHEETFETKNLQAEDPAQEALRTDEKDRLWQAVGALPEPYRTPLVLRFANCMDSNEIAEVLKRPAGTVRYQLSKALAILRERLGNGSEL